MSSLSVMFEDCDGLTEGKNRIPGTVKWFDGSKGYGFVTTMGDEPKDYFVHRSQVWSEDRFPRHPVLLEDEEVEFYIDNTSKGLAAHEVSLPDGKIVPAYNAFQNNNL